MVKKKAEPAQHPMLMTAAEMATVSGIGENTLRTLMMEGKLEYLRIGNKRLISEDAIWAYYNRHKTSVTADRRARIFPIQGLV